MPLNNNQEPNFERRLVLAFVLSAVLFLIALPYLSKKSASPHAAQSSGQAAKPVTAANASNASAPAPAASGAASEKGSEAASGMPAPSASPKASAGARSAVRPSSSAKASPAATIAASQEQAITIDTPVYHVVLSNQGANVRSWILTQYKDDAMKPLDVVGSSFAKRFGYPLEFWSGNEALRQKLNQALYQVKKTTGPGGSQTLTFTWAQGGLAATKTIRFGTGYSTEVHSTVTQDGKPVAVAIAWPGAFGDRAMPGDFGTERFLRQSGSSVDTTKTKDVQNGGVEQGQYQFTGIDDQFFAAVFLPQGENPLTVTTLKHSYEPRLVNATGQVTTNKPVETVGVAVSNGDTNATRLFVGPKKVSLLESVDPALRNLVNFGWFGFLAYPLFQWMNWTYIHWIHNYGWCILFLTFVITMAFFPLKMKAQKSQAKMMALQPKINALNAKMKKYPMRDPRRQEVQKEIMAIYSEHGVNPLGGCLPMLVTLPLIYAFYEMLEVAIELRHAPWIGYIHDLSAKDPYYILPIVVILTQFLTMQFMPTTPGQDPRQAKMMKWLMPIFIGWFFFYLPAGVNLYYLGYNVVSTGQQWVANKTYNAAAVAAVEAHDAKKSGKKKILEGKVISGKAVSK